MPLDTGAHATFAPSTPRAEILDALSRNGRQEVFGASAAVFIPRVEATMALARPRDGRLDERRGGAGGASPP